MHVSVLLGPENTDQLHILILHKCYALEMVIFDKAPFTCSGLGPVILWDEVPLSPEDTGGGGEGGASPLRGGF